MGIAMMRLAGALVAPQSCAVQRPPMQTRISGSWRCSVKKTSPPSSATFTRFITAAVDAYCPSDQSKL
jgi:hypothetical protein